MLTYPPKPNHTGRFFGINGKWYSYDEPKEIISWEFSITFNRWGALVMQNDGTKIYTWPEVKSC